MPSQIGLLRLSGNANGMRDPVKRKKVIRVKTLMWCFSKKHTCQRRSLKSLVWDGYSIGSSKSKGVVILVSKCAV